MNKIQELGNKEGNLAVIFMHWGIETKIQKFQTTTHMGVMFLPWVLWVFSHFSSYEGKIAFF